MKNGRLILSGAAAVIAALTSEPTLARELGGIEIGMSEREALDILRRHGDPTPLSRFQAGYRAGGLNFTTCRGIVYGVNRRLDRSFMAFVRTAQSATERYGDPTGAFAQSNEGEPVSGEVALQWELADGELYTISFLETDGSPYANESLSRYELCRRIEG